MHITITNLLLILMSLTTGINNGLEIESMSLFKKQEKILLNQSIEKYKLKHWPIVKQSEEVFVDGILLSRFYDYEIDYNSGEIIFTETIPSGSTLLIKYEIIPIDIKKKYKRELFTKEKEEKKQETKQRQVTGKQEISEEPSLQVSGTKTFSISMGSKRTLAPDQSLNVNISGNVSENVSVLAILSDQNLPFQPEGTTEELRDIDQKLIKITSPYFNATMGDFRASLGDSELIFFSRALEGFSASANIGPLYLDVIPSAIPKGQSASKVIYGVEGQSEYRIDVDGQFVVVKAGSEIVWLNGERMKRGEDNDYIILDYGEPIIEFTNKHLITSNDVIRVDFEYIREDAAYRKELHGANFGLNFWDEKAKIGISWAQEADDKDNPFILLNDEQIEKLRRNQLDEEQSIFIAPQKHSVWGLNGLLELGESTFIQGEFATDSLDTNSFSTVDQIERNQAWKLLANSSTESIQVNFDVRAYDAGFTPVGGTTQNRTRMLYEERYENEEYGDVFFDRQNIIDEEADESSFRFDLQYQPFDGISLDAGIGKTSRKPENRKVKDALHNTPIPFTSQAKRSVHASRTTHHATTSHQSPATSHQSPVISQQPPDTSHKSPVTIHQTDNWSRGIRVNIPDFPDVYNRYQENATKTNGIESSRQSREIWRFQHQFGKIGITASKSMISSLDFDPSDFINRNYKHDEINLESRLLDFKWMNISGKFGLEENYKKKEKFSVDDIPLSYGNWELDTSAKTWRLSVDSKPKRWLDSAMNFSRRVFKAYGDTGTDTITNLADFNFRLTPLRRSVDLGINYEVDKKLSTEKIEVYTNEINGRMIEPGQGNYVKIDEYHYEEDYEKGDYIRIVRTVGDKPVSSVDAEFRLRFNPSRIFGITSGYNRRTYFPTFQANRTENAKEEEKTPQPLWKEIIRMFEVDARFDITEEQEDANYTELYLLQNLLKEKTLFGRQIQRYRLEFAPSVYLSTELSHYRSQLLNQRINSIKRRQNSQEWDWEINITPTAKLSFEAEYEKRTSQEKLTNLGIEGNQPLNISNIYRDEKTGSLGVEYELSDSLYLRLQGELETEEGLDFLESESQTNTRQSSIKSGFVYSILGKGRLDFSYRTSYGKSQGELPIARYDFYDGISHEVRIRADYKVRKFTDLIIGTNYRFFTSELTKPEHRAEVKAVAEL